MTQVYITDYIGLFFFRNNMGLFYKTEYMGLFYIRDNIGLLYFREYMVMIFIDLSFQVVLYYQAVNQMAGEASSREPGKGESADPTSLFELPITSSRFPYATPVEACLRTPAILLVGVAT